MAPAASSTAAPQFYRAAVVGGLLGLAMATADVTMAASEPPPWLRRDAYLAAVAGAFLAGVALVAASVWAADARAAAEFQKQQQPAFDLERVHGGLLGLAMASSAITLVVSEPLPWLHDHRDAYLVALAAAFFAGVTLVAVSVVSVDAGPSSPRADDVGLVRR
ncbi:hypothetical protein PVAP13_5KG095735 [Panicum virgatum]|uniref:Uncharacterized protein n=1 Tax=Panicum virgatum TaxID=38727 RepID=A0A8T0SHD7_PANVG|nr:hypothetical protein PVAP13_5KG095735 [Panicum virgatum]